VRPRRPLSRADGGDVSAHPRAEGGAGTRALGPYPHAHGAPVHIGDPKAIGIADLSRPEFGDPTPTYPGEVPMFWACGVTPQAVAQRAKVDFMITHEPAQMFVTDLPRER
jgi:uncharacterized protein YcsI (UPF0317 family)